MVLTAILCFLFWIVLNGKFTIEIAAFGVIVTAITLFITKKTTKTDFAPKGNFFGKTIGAIKYLILLLYEIYLANIGMMKIVLTQDKEEMNPAFTTFKTDLKKRGSRIALANSITLTPGTITANLNEDEYVVHGLDASMLEDIGESSFVHALRKMEEL